MKIQLDTTEKSIKVDQTVNAGELFDLLENLLPNGAWRKFNIETNSVIYYNNPITVSPWQPITTPWQPNYPWITYMDNTATIVGGVFDIEYQLT